LTSMAGMLALGKGTKEYICSIMLLERDLKYDDCPGAVMVICLCFLATCVR
jgi:hypothetical protein